MRGPEAFEDWWAGGFMTQQVRSPDEWAKMAWNAALEWARTQQEPVGWIGGTDGLLWREQVDANDVPLYAAPVAPKGWKLVPEEPTREMLNAAYRVCWDDAGVHPSVWRAMLDAAPECKEGE